MIRVTNEEFLRAIFGENWGFAHVTDFDHDPGNIPAGMHGKAWGGNWYNRRVLRPGTNQYFTVSIFIPDEKGVARRRRSLFMATYCIVLDDVSEKLPLEEAVKLPQPSWKLTTSPGSEQWGYILDAPCQDRGRVENLLDGLVSNGLAPGGVDPGMKGVTRLVRLPEGYNTKASKMIDGKPFKCAMTEWEPERRVSMEALAAPFQVDLDRVRRDGRVDGAADMPDHPILDVADLIHVKEVKGKGRFDVTCPWVDEHTGKADDGSAIFTNQDGSMGFKCHHGNCQHRTAKDVIKLVEDSKPGFAKELQNWKVELMFKDIAEVTPTPESTVKAPDFMGEPTQGIDKLIDELRRTPAGTDKSFEIAQGILKLSDSESTMARHRYQDEVMRMMRWTKTEFKALLKGFRKEWKEDWNDSPKGFMSNMLYVKAQNQFYDRRTGVFMTPEGFQNSYADQDPDARKSALDKGGVAKPDMLDFAPMKPAIFMEDNIQYGNLWTAEKTKLGSPGDCNPWLEHFCRLGWGENMDHMVKWMAFTLRHQDIKINHALIMAGPEGAGKDWLLEPLRVALGRYAKTISGEMLLSDYHDHLVSTKLLLVNETELGDHRHANEVGAKLKPLAAAPPYQIIVNPKGAKSFSIRNIMSVALTSNSLVPLKLKGESRRFYAVHTNFTVRDGRGKPMPEWTKFWTEAWEWMNNGGAEYCIHYLLNEVDLAHFNPGAAPPVTDFLEDIQESSKTAAQQTVEAFIELGDGIFNNDMVTAGDAAEFLRFCSAKPEYDKVASQDLMWFTTANVGRILGDISGCAKVRCKDSDFKDKKPWIIRNINKYVAMSPKELSNEYIKQVEKFHEPAGKIIQFNKHVAN